MMPFQTPPPVCDYMASMLCGPKHNAAGQILEPTPGEGNLVAALKRRHPNAEVIAPADFFDLLPGLINGQIQYPRYDHIVMNPPFTPIITGWKFLQHCMQMSDHIVCLLPWFIVINSERRLKILTDFGLQSITHLPRTAFAQSRIQCCVLHLRRAHKGETIFKTFEF